MLTPDRLSIAPLGTGYPDALGDVALASALGLTHMSVAMTKFPDAGVGEAAQAMADAVLASGVTVELVWAGTGCDLTDRSDWNNAADAVGHAFDMASRLGAAAVLSPGGSARGLDFEAARESYIEFTAPLAREARQRGLTLALEPVRTQYAFAGFVHTLADGLALADELDLGLVVDVTHCWWEPRLHETLRRAAPRVVSAHLADLELDRHVGGRVVPGDGDLRISAFVEALVAGGYSGCFEFELVGSKIDAEGSTAALHRAVAAVCGR